MASLFDVMDALQAICVSAITPSGPGTIFGKYVDVAQGWPIADGIDKAMAARRTLVSIYAVRGTTSDPGQIMNWDVEVVVPPVHGMTAQGTDTGFTLTGYPGEGEYATVVLDGCHSYSYAAVLGDLVETVCTALVTDIEVDYPGSTATANTVSIVGARDIIVRIGASASVGEQLHRQRRQIRVVVWAPTPSDRAAVANALDIALKSNLKVAMPDTSTALVTYQDINLDDKFENQGAYRADLIFAVLWDTFSYDDAFEVTSVNITLDAGASLPVTTVQ